MAFAFNTSVISYQAHCQQIVFSDTALKHVNYMILQLTLILHYASECTVFVSLAVPSNKEWHKTDFSHGSTELLFR